MPMPSKEARAGRDPAVERAKRELLHARSGDRAPARSAIRRAAAAQPARPAAVTDARSLAIASLDGAGRIRGFDAGFGALFDRPPAVGDRADALFGDDARERVAAMIVRAESEGRASIALTLTGSDVRPREVDVTVSSLAGGGSRAAGLALVVEPRAPAALDRRAPSTIAAAMDAANRRSAFDLAQAILCHDLGNAVTSALLALQALSGLNRHGALGTHSAATELITRGLDAAHHAAQLVTSARDEERRRHAGPARGGSLGESVESVLLLTRASADGDRVRVTADVDPALSVALGMEELTQVVLNVVVHAIGNVRATGQAGDVRMWAETDGEARVLLHVKDDGAGTEATNARRLFDVTVAAPEERSARIGLAVARRIVDTAGGRIHVMSAPGEGTELVVELPKGAPLDR
jgi:signal transduction histidine kinase